MDVKPYCIQPHLARFEIDRVFKENNIEIAFPQQDIHIRSVEGLNLGSEPQKAPKA